MNGTSALDIAIKTLKIKNGDEILVPSITFIAPVNTIRYNNCSPIFFDCDEYCNIDINKFIEFIKTNTFMKNKITYNLSTKKRISAIILVHVFGNAVDIERIVDTIFEEISNALGNGDRVELRGFGAFSVKERQPRIARNPRTGEPVKVGNKSVPFFKTGKELKNGTLVLNVFHGDQILVEYSKKDIVEKINTFFGYEFIKDIKLILIKEKIPKNRKYDLSITEFEINQELFDKLSYNMKTRVEFIKEKNFDEAIKYVIEYTDLIGGFLMLNAKTAIMDWSWFFNCKEIK